MNFSHGSYEYHQSVIDNARAAVAGASFPSPLSRRAQLLTSADRTNLTPPPLANPGGRPLAIALDTKGPEIRTGLMTNDQDVKIAAGHEFYISTNPADAESGTAEQIFMDYVRPLLCSALSSQDVAR
jgi:pyruvate kinase